MRGPAPVHRRGPSSIGGVPPLWTVDAVVVDRRHLPVVLRPRVRAVIVAVHTRLNPTVWPALNLPIRLDRRRAIFGVNPDAVPNPVVTVGDGRASTDFDLLSEERTMNRVSLDRCG